jgi:hypothetical protein
MFMKNDSPEFGPLACGHHLKYAFNRRAIIHLALSSSDTGGAKRWIAWKA